ncbi:MAG: nucleoside deaminase [Thermodesulfobacteriota bacterium]
MKSTNSRYMNEAVRLSLEAVAEKQGPFGAVVVKDGQVIGRGHNQVLSLSDPTAHAEIVALRAAARALNTFDLSGCDLYASCQPCPMCLAAAYWARIEKVFYANTTQDATWAGFKDELIYQEFTKPDELRRPRLVPLGHPEARRALEMWRELTDKIEY